jgi:N-acetylglutamate synthase-like GNAT family acetyltransferase
LHTTWQVRKGRPEDLPVIEQLVASVDGDLENLKAEQFVVALDSEQRIIGCGRLKPYPGFCELASIAVKDEWRASGVGRAVVSQLLRSYQGPVYLICEDDVVDFFRRFGFDLIPTSEMLPGLQSKWERYVAEVGHLNVMRRD